MFDGLFYGIVGPTDDHPYGGGEALRVQKGGYPATSGLRHGGIRKQGCF